MASRARNAAVQAVYFDSSRNGWECKTRHPKRKFTLKTGTIFEDSPLGFDKWLPVRVDDRQRKNGISSYEIHRAIGVTQKTAWFMLQRIRLAMQDENAAAASSVAKSKWMKPTSAAKRATCTRRSARR